MERYGLHKRPTACKVTLGAPVLAPRAPESLAEACQELYRIASAVTSGHNKVVLSFSFYGSTVRLDLTDAKAATVICAIGIGVGLGTYLLYKIYCRYTQSSNSKKKLRKRHRKHPPRDDSVEEADEESSFESTENEMGNSGSADTLPVRYSPVSGVHIGRRTKPDNHLHNTSGAISKSRHRKRHREKAKLLSSSYDTIESPSNLNGISPNSKTGIDISHTSQGGTADRLTHSTSDINETSSICGSLKGNLSLKSLYERNDKYGFSENYRVFEKCLKPHSSEESLQIEISSGCDVPSISSVLLTPPSEEDGLVNRRLSIENFSGKDNLRSSWDHNCVGSSDHAIYDDHIENGYLETSYGKDKPLFDTYEKNQSQKNLLHDSGITDQSIAPSHNTDSSNISSPQHSSNSSKLYSNYTTDISGNLSLDDDCDTNSSPLYRVKIPDKQFRQSLLHRLHEYANFGGSSTSASLNSTPEVSPCHQARTSIVEQDDSISGNGTPDQEIFSPGEKLGETTTECFETLEHEVCDIADEFHDICAKLDELKRLAAGTSGSEDTELDSEFTPSDPVARRACSIVERTREIIRSRSMSLSENSDGSRCNSFLDTDGVELSWDSEHMTEEQSQNKQSRLKYKLHALAKTDAVESQTEEEESEEKFHTASDKSDSVVASLVPDKCNSLRSSPENSKASRMADWSMSVEDSEESVSISNCFQCGKIKIPVKYLDLSGFDVDICRCSERRSDDTDQDVDTEFDSGVEEVCNGNNVIHKETASHGPQAVGKSMNMMEYAEREWRGQTDKAICIKKAYHEVPKILECRHIRQIRGDNYCAVRGAVFQCLANNIDIANGWSSASTVIESLQKHFNADNSGLKHWNFANRLPYTDKDALNLMAHCVQVLFTKCGEAKALSSYKYRLEWAAQVLNTDADCDVQMMEAVKLLMYLTALKLYRQSTAGQDVPVFVWLMFARDTSENPSMFVRNHLNCVGDSAGLEQVEMCLLGYTLGVRIKVIRLCQYGEEDFVTSFPEESEPDWPIISLLAEDDRHYNVPVSESS